MNQATMLVYVVGGVAVALAVARNIFFVFMMKINAAMLTAQLEKLILANNIDRAIKLCNAVPGKLYSKGALALLKAYQEGTHGAKALRQVFEEAIVGHKKRIALGRVVGIVAFLVAAAGLGYGVINAETVAPEAYAVPGFGILAAVFGEMSGPRMIAEAEQGAKQVIAALGQHYKTEQGQAG